MFPRALFPSDTDLCHWIYGFIPENFDRATFLPCSGVVLCTEAAKADFWMDLLRNSDSYSCFTVSVILQNFGWRINQNYVLERIDSTYRADTANRFDSGSYRDVDDDDESDMGPDNPRPPKRRKVGKESRDGTQSRHIGRKNASA